MDLAAEYNNRDLVPNHPRIIADWYADAAAYRREAKGDYDIRYGARARNVLDLFHPAQDRGGPLVVFIHGGYWKSFDKSVFSHMARGMNARGWPVAVPSYSLCPEVTVPDIIDELRQSLLFLWRQHRRPLVVCGHSAGGHLAGAMAATGWSHYGAPADLVASGLSISGLFDLRPLMATPHNAELRLTAVDAMTASPLFWPMPRKLAFDSWVGAEESMEFKRQARSLAAAWTGLGCASGYVEIAGENHFSVPRSLAEPDGLLTKRLAQLAA